MVAALLNSSPTLLGSRPVAARPQPRQIAGRKALVARAGAYDEELIATAVSLTPAYSQHGISFSDPATGLTG